MDDPLKKLKAFFSPTNLQKASRRITKEASQVPWLDSLYKSPVADSLYGIVDVPSSLGVVPPDMEATTAGMYTPNTGDISMNKAPSAYDRIKVGASSWNPRDALIHEMGHKNRNDTKTNIDNYRLSPRLYSNAEIEATKDASAKGQNYVVFKEDKARNSVDSYYKRKPEEAYAQAFKNAFNFLSETALKPDMDYRKFAGDLEGNTPGMGLIVQDLMKRPIFAKHPLQGKIFREKK